MKTEPAIDVIESVRMKADFVIEKNTYTACTDDIVGILREMKIEEVYLVGIDTDCCVLKTTIDLFERNIRPIVISSCCTSNGGLESHIAALRVLERTIGKEQIVF